MTVPCSVCGAQYDESALIGLYIDKGRHRPPDRLQVCKGCFGFFSTDSEEMIEVLTSTTFPERA